MLELGIWSFSPDTSRLPARRSFSEGGIPDTPFGYEQTPIQIKPQRHRGGLGNSNPRGGHDRSPALPEFFHVGILGDEQGRVRIAQINSVQTARNVHRATQLSWPAGQLFDLGHWPLGSQKIEAVGRFHRADQDRFRHARRTAHGVRTKMKTVNQVNVAMPRQTEHHPVPRRQPGCAMTRRITHQVRFRFDNRAAARSSRRVANQKMTEQLRRDNLGGRLVERPGQGCHVLHLCAVILIEVAVISNQ
jgi:hypothetical protein